MMTLDTAHYNGTVSPGATASTVDRQKWSEEPMAKSASPLPAPRSALIGREAEVRAVCALLHRADVGLVTLTGAGGIGKTRLALAVAEQLRQELAGGVVFVDLAPLTQADRVAPAIAQALQLPEQAGRPPLDQLIEALRGSEILLVLDNFEHLLDAAPVVSALLTGCPRLKVLVTSRSVLRVQGEWDYEVLPLPLPGEATAEALNQNPAVALFVERARAAWSGFEPDEGSLPVIAEICHRLDGLPLAIELAASRVRVLRPAALLDRLDRRLSFLTGGARDLPARQQTLRATIQWSYDLLSPDEQALFRRLSLFAGSCTFDELEAVAQASPAIAFDLLDGITALVDHNLVRQISDGLEPRLSMLATVQEFGIERLVECGELDTVRQAQAEYFADLAESVGSKLYTGEAGRLVDRLLPDLDNLRQVLNWCFTETNLDHRARSALGVRILGALGHEFWIVADLSREAREWLSRAVASFPPLSRGSTEWRAFDRRWLRALGRCLRGLGFLTFSQEAVVPAIPLLEEALIVLEAAGDRIGQAFAFGNLALCAQRTGRFSDGIVFARRAVEVARESGDPYTLAFQLHYLWSFRYPDDSSLALIEDCLRHARRSGNPRILGLNLASFADEAARRGDLPAAERHYAEVLDLGDLQRSPTAPQAYALVGLGRCFLDDPERSARDALPNFRDGFLLARRLGFREIEWLALLGLAQAAWRSAGPDKRAASLVVRILAAAEYRHQATGVSAGSFRKLHGVTDEQFQAFVDALRSAVGTDEFDRLWHDGQVLPYDDLVALVEDAVAETASSADADATQRNPAGLSDRELQVLRLVAAGKSNAEIAASLVISINTVYRHVSNIFDKAGVSNRHEATAFARRNRLADEP